MFDGVLIFLEGDIGVVTNSCNFQSYLLYRVYLHTFYVFVILNKLLSRQFQNMRENKHSRAQSSSNVLKTTRHGQGTLNLRAIFIKTKTNPDSINKIYKDIELPS